jgi:hypothetical protein
LLVLILITGEQLAVLLGFSILGNSWLVFSDSGSNMYSDTHYWKAADCVSRIQVVIFALILNTGEQLAVLLGFR